MKQMLWRDLQLAARLPSQWLLPLAFFVAAASMFPLGIGADTAVLARIAPGVVWVCALLAMMLSVSQLFNADHQDGSLEQMLIGTHWLPGLVAMRVLGHWLQSGVPLVLLAPVFGLLFDCGFDAAFVVTRDQRQIVARFLGQQRELRGAAAAVGFVEIAGRPAPARWWRNFSRVRLLDRVAVFAALHGHTFGQRSSRRRRHRGGASV